MPSSRCRSGAFEQGSGFDGTPFEKLVGDLAGACSRRINIKHRLVYQVLDDVRTVKVIRMWTRYQ